MGEKDILLILKTNLSEQSKWLLYTLTHSKENELLPKEILWEKTNALFQSHNKNNNKVISSRYILDIHTSRLEGAGLIAFEQFGKVKCYKITDFGNYFYKNL